MVGAYINNVATVCGGNNGAQDRCSQFSFDTNSWSLAPFSLNQERRYAAAVLLPNMTFFVMGGVESTNAETTTELLIDVKFEYGPELPDRYILHCTVMYNETHVFIGGGFYAPNSAYFLEIDFGTWTQVTDMNEERWEQ